MRKAERGGSGVMSVVAGGVELLVFLCSRWLCAPRCHVVPTGLGLK